MARQGKSAPLLHYSSRTPKMSLAMIALDVIYPEGSDCPPAKEMMERVDAFWNETEHFLLLEAFYAGRKRDYTALAALVTRRCDLVDAYAARRNASKKWL